MDKKEKARKKLIESLVVTIIMVVYIVYGIYFLPILVLFIPIPFIVLGIRNGFDSNILSIILTFFIVQIIIGDTIGASLVFILAPLSIAINYCVKKRMNSKMTILISTISFLLPIIILITLGINMGNIDLVSELKNLFSQYISIQAESLKEMGLTNHEVLKVINEVETGYNELIMLIPSLLGVFSIFITYINYFLTGVVLRQTGYEVIKRPIFSRFQLPNNIILGVGVMLITGFIFKWLNIEYSQALLLNITFLIGVMFMVQGLAVLDFILKRRKTKLVFRIILIVLSLMFLPMGSFIIFLGIIDSIFDTRKLRRLKS